MLFSVVIPTHDRSDALRRTLEHLAAQRFDGPWEVVVVNNRCTDDTDEVIRGQPFPVPLRLIHQEAPGAGAARNAGAAAARGLYLAFLDNDILTEPDYLRRHYDVLTSHPGCWVVGQVVLLPEQRRTAFGKFREMLNPSVPPERGLIREGWFSGAICSLPRADWQRLGGFDEGFDGAGMEDLDFPMRARKAGIPILADPRIVAVHNDWTGFDIRDYCRRQCHYARHEAIILKKYGADHPNPEFVRRNLPLAWDLDRGTLMASKVARGLLSRDVVQAGLRRACGLVERYGPNGLLWPLYRLMLSGAIYQGFREGLALQGVDPRKISKVFLRRFLRPRVESI